jgi:hypothetical protein
MKNAKVLAFCILSSATTLSCFGRSSFTLNPAWEDTVGDTGLVTYGTGGTNGYNQRGVSYDPVSGNLVFVEPRGGQSGSANVQGFVHILNANTGNLITDLNTNGIAGGSWADYAVGVADDGVVFVCNHVQVSTNNSTPFKIYRWDSVSSVNPPTVAFSANLLPNQRYGATMDVRGAGANTEILIGSKIGGAATTGTNVVIFNTTDGLTFNTNVIACTNAGGANFSDGIAFGTNNTFWAKTVGGPLLFMSYDLTARTAKTLGVYNSTNLAGYANLGPLAVDNVNHLLAAMEVTGGSERLWLFDITDPTQPPLLLKIQPITAANNANSTAPAGFLDFGGGKVFAHVVNNSLAAFTVDAQSTPAPFFEQDLPSELRISSGQNAHFEVVADPLVTSYQWAVNGNDIPGATKFYLDLPNVQLSDSGKVYTVRAINPTTSTTSSGCTLTVVNAADLAHLDLLWSAAEDTTNYVSNGGAATPNERSIAYSPGQNQLYVVRRAGPFFNVFVLNATNGAVLYSLNTAGINGGTIPLVSIGVADDGAIYACNVQDATSNLFRIYRWADSGPATVPVKIFEGNPGAQNNSSNLRWGDTLAVRGSGTSTEIILDNTDPSQLLRFASVVVPSDPTLLQPWAASSYSFQYQDGSATVGRSLQFGIGDTFWQKRMPAAGNATPFVQSSFDLSNPGSVAPTNGNTSYTLGQPVSTNGATAIDLSGSNLGATINYTAAFGNNGTSPSTLDLYDFTTISSPVLLNRYNFPVTQLGNAVPNAQVIFGTNSFLGKSMVFALDANNGLMAYTYAFGPVSKPRFLLQPDNTRIIKGGTNFLVVVNDQTVPLQWRKDGADIANATNAILGLSGQFTNAGNYVAVASNSSGFTTSQVATVTVSIADDNYSLATLWSKAPAASVGGANYVSVGSGTAVPNERGFGYDALSNHIIIPQRQGSSSTTYQVHVVDAANGTYLYDLSVSGVNSAPGSEVAGANAVGLTDVAVADDGAVFGCNETPNASGGSNGVPSKMFQVYRWPNSGNGALPSTVWLGDPAGEGTTNNVRWGDQMSVRGGGLDTQLIFDSNDGFRAAVLQTNAVTGGFSNSIPIFSVSFNASIGRNTQFATGTNFNNTTNFWQKRKGEPLQLTTFNTNDHSSSFVAYGNFPPSLGILAVDSDRKLAIGVDHSASTPALALYDINDPNSPMLITRKNFPASNGNGNFIGKVIISGNKVYALSAFNGMVAATIQNPAGRPSLTVSQVGANAVVSWPTNNVGWTLQSTSALSPASWSNVGGAPGTVGGNFVVTNAMSAAAFYRLAQ